MDIRAMHRRQREEPGQNPGMVVPKHSMRSALLEQREQGEVGR